MIWIVFHQMYQMIAARRNRPPDLARSSTGEYFVEDGL